MESIKKLFFEITKFFSVDVGARKDIAICFRCIISCGVDPTVLKADAVEWVSDGYSAQIKDIQYIQTLFRDSSAIDAVVEQFQWCVEAYVNHLSELRNATMSNVASNHPSTAVSHGGSYDSDDDDNAASTVPLGERGVFVASKKAEISVLRDLSYAMLDLCLDLAKNTTSAAHMCRMRVCNSAIKLLGESVVSGSCCDQRTCVMVELLWTVLESYFIVLESAEEGDGVAVDPSFYEDVVDFEPAIVTLKDVLLALLKEGYKLADKEVRNEVLVVLTILAKFPNAFPSFLKCGLLTVLVTYACIGESGKRAWPFLSQPLAKFRNFATVFEADLQFKRELWMLIGDLLRYDDCDALTCVASSPLLPYMHSFLDRNSLVDQQHSRAAKGEDHEVDSHTNGNGPASPTVASQMNQQSMVQSFDSSSNGDLFSFPVQNQSALETAPDGSVCENSTQSDNSLTRIQERANNQPHLTQLDKDSKASATYLSSIPTSELRELQVLVMIFLAENAHKMMGEFLRIGGPTKALDIIYTYCSSSFSEHKRLVYYALLLQNRCILNSISAKRILESENAIQIWLYVFETSDEDATRAAAAKLIACMCSNNLVCQSQLRQLGGIELFVQALSGYTDLHRPVVGRKAGIKLGQHTDNDLENPDEYRGGGEVSVLIVTVLDCLCRGVVGNAKNEYKLAQVEGIDALLDLLEVTEFLLRIKVLRLLSDLLQNQRLISYLSAWRSAKTMRSAAQIFCHCYIDEEARLNCSRENGVINNLWNPLGNHAWPPDITVPPPNFAANGGNESLAVTRLTNAILASRNVNSNGMTDSVRDHVLQKDVRGIIVSILMLMGLLYAPGECPEILLGSPSSSFDNRNTIASLRRPSNVSTNSSPMRGDLDSTGEGAGEFVPFDANEMEYDQDATSASVATETTATTAGPKIGITMSDDEQNGITPLEKQVISIAKRFNVLKEGQWWLGVSLTLKEEGILPIDADLQMIDGHLSRYFEAARIVQFEQMELHALDQRLKKNQENVFINSIVQKKNAQIKAEWLKKNSKNNPKSQSILAKIR